MKTFDELVIEGREAIARSRQTIAESNRIIQSYQVQGARLLISSAHIRITIASITARRLHDDRTLRKLSNLRELSKNIL